MRIVSRKPFLFAFLWLFILPNSVPAQTRGQVNEAKTARYFATIQTDPLLLLPFLRKMPKGGDLHNHFGGGIYAESFIDWAVKSNLCIEMSTLSVFKPDENKRPCVAKPADMKPSDPSPARRYAAEALKDPTLYNRLVDAWSMRNWQLSGQSGHDHFFDTFGKSGAAGYGRSGEMLADVTNLAASEGVSYLELMSTLDGSISRNAGAAAGWNDDLAALRSNLLVHGVDQAVSASHIALDDGDRSFRTLNGCGTPGAKPGCSVRVRFIYQVLRAFSPAEVFAQMLTGFELASADPRVVGLNLVQPEDSFLSMQDFSLHMRMLGFLRQQYPKVHLTLHAGELAAGLVRPEGLRFHIRESVEIARADRIGHGVDVMHEDDPIELLQKMAQRNTLVEICLTSNDVILGVRGKEHPLRLYLKYGVPVALASDDLGVSRSDMTHEYLRAALDQGMNYLQLKMMARNSLSYSFIAGSNLWADVRKFVPVNQCLAGWDTPVCRSFLSINEKAALQIELEKSFTAFERKY
ncbi:MAG: adenosine deaminase [Pyrinomonadaceae bacterium]